jgi:hypothetical protein
MGPGIDDEISPATTEATNATGSKPLPPKTIQVIVYYSLSGSGHSTNTPIKEYTSKITFKRPRYTHVLARANALRKHGHLLLVGGLKQYKWIGAALEKETVRDFMTPDFWKANLFLTDNGGGGSNDTLKANVAELKSLLTTGDGSSRVKMYASPRFITQMKDKAEADL